MKEIKEKYLSGDYICVVENRFGSKGYFVKENDEFKENWNYTLIHKKHKDILEVYLKDNSAEILTNQFSLDGLCVFPELNFIDNYREKYDYILKDVK